MDFKGFYDEIIFDVDRSITIALYYLLCETKAGI